MGPEDDVKVLSELWQLLATGTEEKRELRGDKGQRRDPRAALRCGSSSIRPQHREGRAWMLPRDPPQNQLL